MDKQVKRTERGWAGHFICASMCEFRRNTLLEYGDKKWVVSTVGRMVTTNPETRKEEFTTIGYNRYYETMAFVGTQDEYGYIDADVSQMIEFDSKCAISDIKEDSEQRANDMHEEVVAELAEMIKGAQNG
jgi:hypothetical protein